MEIALVLFLLLASIVLFATEKLSVDVITVSLIIILMTTGILTPAEAFAGFGSDFIIILVSIFVISGALRETGVLDRIGSQLVNIGSVRLSVLSFYIMGVTGLISAFMNNTTVTALFVGPIMGIARKTSVSASRLLIPLAFASILGGTCTLIGTSTNVAVSGYLKQTGMPAIGMFEILPVGIVMLGVGVAYMLLIGRHLLPDHKDISYTEDYSLREYLSEVIVVSNSPLIGQKILSSNFSRIGLRILRVIRGSESLFPDPQLVIEPHDLLLVEGRISELIKVKETNGIEIRADMLEESVLESNNVQLAEVLITNGRSDLVGSTIKRLDFRKRYGLVVLAIYRHGQSLRDKISNIDLQLGDLLLVQGAPERMSLIRESRDLAILGEFEPIMYREKRGTFTIGLFLLAVVVGSLEWLPLSVCFLTAALLAVVSKAIKAEKAYSVIDWRLIVLIGGMSAFGTAMQKTGASEFLADNIVHLLSPWGKTGILAGFILLTVLLTQPMSNAAAALVVLPIALETAHLLNCNPRTFAIGIMLAASVSLVTPFEPSCILVYGPGKYRFADFLKVGSGLTVILMILLIMMVPLLWPF